MSVKLKMKRRAVYGIIALAVIAVPIVRTFVGAKDKPIIRTAKVERGTVTSSVSANGVIQPLTTVEVKSNVGGQVVKLAVDEGSIVTAGQLIARVDPTDTQTALDQSQADLASAVSRVDQARQTLAMQRTQNTAQIESAKQSLASARAKLLQAQEQSRVQPTLTRSAISQAKSNLSSAEASLKQTRTALVPQKLSSAQAGYDQAQASYSATQKDIARQKELLKLGFVSESQVEASEEKFIVAKAQLDSARRKLDTIKDETDQDLITAQARVDQARAELENAKTNSIQDKVKQQELLASRAAMRQSEAALQSAVAATHETRIRQGDIIQANSQVQRTQASVKNSQQQLDYATVVAPRAGVVTKKYVEVGSIVTAGRSSISGTGSGVAIVDIADVSRMFAMVNVDETDIAQIEVGQEVDVTVQAYPDELFNGKVTKISPQSVTDQSVTTIPVTVEIDLPDQRLKPGMNVNCDFITGRADDVLMVPSEAVKESDDSATVTILDHDKQTTRKVEIGLAGGDNIEIKSGLKEGDVVITAIIEPVVATERVPAAGMGGQGRSGGMGGMGGGFGGGGGGGGRRGM